MNELMNRLNQIFEGILGCQFEFHTTDTLSESQWRQEDLKLVRQSSSETPRYIEGTTSGCFGFPITTSAGFQGLAVITGMTAVETTKLLLVGELLSLVFESSLRMQDRHEQLRTIEERLSLLEEKSNVIPFRAPRFGRALYAVEPAALAPKDFTPKSVKPLLIQAKPGYPLQRVAIEIHQKSNRWAFLSIDDLPKDIFDSKESLLQLGSITLFIPNIALLTTNQQLKLGEFLALQPSADMPHIIAGCTESASELQESRRVLEHVLESFELSNLDWNEDGAEQTPSEFVKTSIEHLIEEPPESHQVGSHIIPFHPQYFDPTNPTMH